LMSKPRVVITGMGVVTPIGQTVEEFSAAVAAGKNGVARVTHFDPSSYRSQAAAEVVDFSPDAWIDRKTAARMDRFTQFAVVSSAMALQDAGLAKDSFDSHRAGVVIGSGIGGSQTIEEGYEILKERGPKGLSPFFVSKLLINMAACMVSIRHGLQGPVSAPSVACSTGANAIGDSFRVIQSGHADIMVAGGAEACITPLAYGGFCAARAMSTHPVPEHASRPFDRNRDGFVMGEGSGVVVLERLDHALSRKARIYAELIGYGCTADAHHLTAPHPEGDGMARAMSLALADANREGRAVGYVNAHGTSTVLNDRHESTAIARVFGDHVAQLRVSSIKSMIGHLMAAAGAVEFISTVLSIASGELPPTINHHEPDPLCSLNLVTNPTRVPGLRLAMSSSFGFGGGNACLVVERYGGNA